SRKAVQLSGWSEGFVGEPGKVTLVYPARVIPDAIWTGKVTAVVENSLGGRYRVKSLQERKHRLELERFEPEQAPQEEQAIS
ncbi:hypothetical protein OJ594_12410, partial [Streptococcus anginosus]|nr:hypothetical protein [Streptococcus anginosus]